MQHIHRQQAGNTHVEGQLLLHAGQAQLPIVAEHSMSAVAEYAAEYLCSIAQTAGTEDDERPHQNTEGPCHTQGMPDTAAAPGREMIFRRLTQTVQPAPDKVGPPCTVPQAADQKGEQQVAVFLRSGAAAAAQRDINIIPQPAGEADMPPRPDILDRIRKEGLAEVFGQRQTQHLTDAENNVRIAGEIRIELHRKQHRSQQQLGAVIGGGVCKHCIHHNRSAVSHCQLFEIPPCAALHTAPDAGAVPSCRAVHLGHQLVITVEGPLRDGEKK